MAGLTAAGIAAALTHGVNGRLYGVVRVLEAFQGEDRTLDDDVMQLLANALGDAVSVVDGVIEQLGQPAPAERETGA